MLDLEVDHAAFIISREPEIAAIADDQFTPRIGVPDLGSRPAIDVDPVENREHDAACVDMILIDLADLGVHRLPRLDPIWPRMHRLDLAKARRTDQLEGIDHLAMFA